VSINTYDPHDPLDSRVIATEEEGTMHYLRVVLRDDQFDKIAEAVARRLVARLDTQPAE
jgi:hypothetical protein